MYQIGYVRTPPERNKMKWNDLTLLVSRPVMKRTGNHLATLTQAPQAPRWTDTPLISDLRPQHTLAGFVKLTTRSPITHNFAYYGLIIAVLTSQEFRRWWFTTLDFFQVEKKAAKTTAVLILSSPESKLGSIELLDGEYRFTMIKVWSLPNLVCFFQVRLSIWEVADGLGLLNFRFRQQKQNTKSCHRIRSC